MVPKITCISLFCAIPVLAMTLIFVPMAFLKIHVYKTMIFLSTVLNKTF